MNYPTLPLTFEEGEWVARDEHTGLTVQAPTHQEALEALDSTVAVQEGDISTDDLFIAVPIFEGEPTNKDDIDDIVYGKIDE